MFVGVDFASRFDVLDYFPMEHFAAGAFDGEGDGLAAPFARAENGLLADRSTSGVEILPFVLVGFLAADERLVDFHDALELSARIAVQGFAQPSQKEPCRTLCDGQFLGKLKR